MSATLVIFIEGNDDERFFRKIVVPRLAARYSNVRLVLYAQRRWGRTANIIRATQQMHHEYIFVSDFDYGPSIRERIEELCRRYPPLNPHCVVIVRREIEGWYLAGLDDGAAVTWGIRNGESTDDLTKEQFNLKIPPKFFPRMVFMREILDHYSLDRGMAHNASLAYFCRKYRLTAE